MARKKSSAYRKRQIEDNDQNIDNDQNVEQSSKSTPTKQQSRCLQPMASGIPPSTSSDTVSRPSDPPARTSHVTLPPSIQEGVHSPLTSKPRNSLAGRTLRSIVALETENNDGKTILYLDGQGFLPSRLAANEIGDIFKRHFTDPWPSWKKIPSSTRNSWFEEFLMKFSISPPDYNWAKKNFEMRGSILMKNSLNKARTTTDKPIWIKDGVWERLRKHWSSEGFIKKSTQAKANRASTFGASHTGGSISTSQHRANMMKETGIPPTPLELFRRTHQRKDNTWVNWRSDHVNETVTHTLEQLTNRALAQGNPPPSELDVWCDVAKTKKGKVYGLAMESTVIAGRPCCHGSSSSSTEWVKKQEVDELRREVQGFITERDELQTKVANTERLIEQNNALIRQLMESMNHQSRSRCGKSRSGWYKVT